MTYSTLAAIVKYPFSSNLAGSHGKFGFFESERQDFERIAEDLGMRCLEHGEGTSIRYARHPLVFLMEAAETSAMRSWISRMPTNYTYCRLRRLRPTPGLL